MEDTTHPQSHPQPHPVQTHRKKITGRTKLALWLILGPTVFIALSVILFSVINLVFNPTFWPKPDTADVVATPLGLTIINVILGIVGSISVIAWLPGIIAGAVLLGHRPKKN